jgi:hypothetical protein
MFKHSCSFYIHGIMVFEIVPKNRRKNEASRVITSNFFGRVATLKCNDLSLCSDVETQFPTVCSSDSDKSDYSFVL